VSTLEKRPPVEWQHLRRCRQCQSPVESEKFTRFLAQFQSRRCKQWQWMEQVKLSQPSPQPPAPQPFAPQLSAPPQLQPTLDRVGGGDEL
jgi:hypothetical protein